MRTLILAAAFPGIWAGAAMLLGRLSLVRPRMSLAERLAPYAPLPEPKWTDEVERWLDEIGESDPE